MHTTLHKALVVGIRPLIIALVITLWGSLPLHANALRSTIYDGQIRKWTSFYTPSVPWYWNKAQLKAESALRPNATSPVGAMGLGQFMPATWEQMKRELGYPSDASAYAPSYNIQAQAYYMMQLRNQFRRPRPEKDRHSLALASYNAGLGNVLKAQKLGGNSLLYSPMANSLHLVTGKHHVETTTYVNRIWEYIEDYETKYN